ncbi:laccase domain-containing protein, partial [Klebsiella aerogenes]|uniref:laccase domain-containing protein n=1 Tax=Klebsiella aerogenes TaxID=548 RepID=UPI001967DB5E
RSIPMSAMFSMIVLRMKACPQHSTGKEGVTISLNILAWLGPAIGPEAFEVGAEVREAFIAKDAQAQSAFRPAGEKYFANIYQLARQRLANVGVEQIFGGDRCTLSEKDDFFSYRRDKTTGRMASFIWLI